MAQAVGVELTEDRVRILSLEHGGKRPRILRFYAAPIPAGADVPWETRAAAALKEAFAASKIPRVRVVAGLDSGEAVLREVSLPFRGDDQIRKTIRFEMESQIQNHAVEDLVVAHYKTGETEKGTLLLAAAVPKTAVAKRLKAHQDAGVDPVALDLDVCAIFNAMLHAGAISTDDPQLLVFGGVRFTKLVFVERKRPKAIRTIRFAMPSTGVEETLILIPSGEEPSFGDLAREEQTALIDILAREIGRFLLAHAATATPSHILLAGELEDGEAAQRLEAAVEIPVRTVNLLDAVDHPFAAGQAAPSAGIIISLGLALKGAGADALGMDFRQGEFQYRKRFEAIKTTALVTIELVIVLLAAVALYYYFKGDDLRRASDTVLAAQVDLYNLCRNDSDPEVGDPSGAFEKMTDLSHRTQAMMGTELPVRISAREAWRELFRALQNFQQKYGPQTLGDGALHLELGTLDVQQTTTPGNELFSLTLRGKVRNLEFANALKNEVRAIPPFENADFEGQLTVVEDGLYQFQLKAQQKRQEKTDGRRSP